MRIIKKINNNAAIALDSKGKEIVVFGKGIGFEKTPYELDDLSRIDRTFYNVDSRYIQLIQEIDEKVLRLCLKMVQVMTSKLEGQWNPNLVFILADHISFAIERQKKGLDVQFSYSDEIEQEHPNENAWAAWMVKNINHNFKIKLPKGEITCIAMHIINAKSGQKKRDQETIEQRSDRILNKSVQIIEESLGSKISKKDLNYYRFKSHIVYFVKRKEKKEEFQNQSNELFETMKKEYPRSWVCARKINEYLKKDYGSDCSEDELLYLMIHINRFLQQGL